MTRSIVEDLSYGVPRLGVPPVAGTDLASLSARAGDVKKVSLRKRDQALHALIKRYRNGNQRLWAPLILDLMAPAIVTRLQRYSPAPPVITEEDIAQQLVLQILIAAATMPIPEDGAFLERALLKAAAKPVSRWLQREDRRQEYELPLLEDDPDDDLEIDNDDA
jgi:hypothetical protein